MFGRSSFNDFTAKYGKDERFKGVDKMRDREQIFSDYLIELRQREKEESRTHREKVFYHMIWTVCRIELTYCGFVAVQIRDTTCGSSTFYIPVLLCLALCCMMQFFYFDDWRRTFWWIRWMTVLLYYWFIVSLHIYHVIKTCTVIGRNYLKKCSTKYKLWA